MKHIEITTFLPFFHRNWRMIIAILSVAICCVIFVLTLNSWSGAWWSYLLFSVTFNVMLYGAIKRKWVGYLFLSATLWIGFWLKLSLHTINKTLTWREPTGRFDFTPSAWDDVAIISSVGAIAVILAGIAVKNRSKIEPNKQEIDLSKTMRLTTWIVAICIAGVTVSINEAFNIFHAGFAPDNWHLPFHLQGFLNWYLGASLLVLLVPFYLEQISGRSLIGPLIIVLMCSTAIGISFCSRSTVGWMSIYILISLWLNKSHIKWLTNKRLALIILLAISATFIAALGAQTRREGLSNLLTQPKTPTIQEMPSKTIQEMPSKTIWGIRTGGIFEQLIFSQSTLWHMASLPIDRWVGLEGLMATIAYPNKDMNMLIREISQTTGVDFYTSEVANTSLDKDSMLAYVTLAGLFAYWYMGGDLAVMFLVVALLSVVIIKIEEIYKRIVPNQYLVMAAVITTVINITMSPGGRIISTAMLLLSLAWILLLSSATNYWLTRTRRYGLPHDYSH